QHRQLRAADLATRVVGLDVEFERALLESFVVQPEAIAVPLQHLHAVAASIEKHEQTAVERIVTKCVSDHGEQAVVCLAEIDRVASDEDADACRQAQHGRSALTRSRNQLMSVPADVAIS